MNILFITPTLPYPPDSGGRIVVYNTIKHLSKGHQITLLSFAQEEQERYIPCLKGYCIKIETVSHDNQFSKYGLLRNLFSSLPYNTSKYYSNAMKMKISEVTEQNSFDMVFIEHLHMAQYAEFIRGVPILLREHNIETMMMKRYYKNASNPLEKIYAYLQWRKLKKYESTILNHFDCCIVLSKVDQMLLQRLSPRAKTEVIPCGVDLEYFKPWSGVREKNKIIFIGNLLFKPTFEGVFYFLNQIWPLIKKNRKDVGFHIVGPYPPERQAELVQYPDVTLLGYVKDVRPQMLSSAVEVVPLKIASGVRLKILEAMAMNLPIVSTSVGCEGLDVVSGKHILIADSPEGFAEKVLTLLEDEKLRNKLMKNSFALIREKYSWEGIIAQLNQLCLNFTKSYPLSTSTI